MSHDPGGAPLPAQYPAVRAPLPTAKRGNWLASSAFAVAVIALALCWSIVGGVFFAVVSVVLALSARASVGRGHADNAPVATASIALSVVAIVVSLAVIPIWVRIYHDVDMTSYLTCMSRASDPPRIDQCGLELRQRVDDRLGVPA